MIDNTHGLIKANLNNRSSKNTELYIALSKQETRNLCLFEVS